jgi:hypothetical protein
LHLTPRVRQELESRLARIEDEAAKTKLAETRRRDLWAFSLGSLILLVLLELVFSGLAYLTRWHWGFWKTNISSWSIALGLWVWMIDLIGQRNTTVKTWRTYLHVHKLRKWVYGTVLTELLIHGLWDYLKKSFE